MTIEEAIAQLEDLKKDRESFVESDEPDGVFKQDMKAIDIAVKALEENKQLKQMLNRMSQTKVNHKIKNPLASTSGLCCCHCDHKDEYIIELEEENEELKRMLKGEENA